MKEILLKILIVYFSGSGNTKKVSELLQKKLQDLNHEVLVKNALTAKTDQVENADLLMIGTPIHGYILFGQKHAKELNKFISSELPEDLSSQLNSIGSSSSNDEDEDDALSYFQRLAEE